MPGMNGADLARRAVGPSGHPGSDRLGLCGERRDRADLPRLTKPFRNAELATKLSELASGA